MPQVAKLSLYIDGQKIGTLQDCTVENSSGKIPIENLEKGLAGFSVGAGRTTVSGKCFIPLGGQEFDFMSAASQEGGEHEVQVPVGSKSYIGEGWFETASVSQSTGQGAEVSFSFLGESNKLE